MNILFIKHFFVGFMVSEIPRVSVLWQSPLLILYIYIAYTIITYDILYKNIVGGGGT